MVIYCRHGHKQTPANAYVRPNGNNYCRICKRIAQQAKYQQDDEHRQRTIERAVAGRKRRKQIEAER